MKLSNMLLLSLALIPVAVNAAVVKQLLNDQNLAIIELQKDEKINVGENFLISESKTQCLLEVLNVENKFATVSSAKCADKDLLKLGRKVEKSLFAPTLLKQNVPEVIIAEKTAAIPVAGIEQKSEEPTGNFGVNDLLYFPKVGEVSGRTTFSVSSDKEEIAKLSVSATTNASFIYQDLNIGFSDNAFFSITIPYVIKSDSELNGVSLASTSKLGIQSPLISLILRGDPARGDHQYSYLEGGLAFSPKGADDQYLSDDYFVFGFAYNVGYEDQQKLKLALAYTNFNETDVIKSHSAIVISASVQAAMNSDLYVRLTGKLQQSAEIAYKNSTLKIDSNVFPAATVGLGGVSATGNFDWLLGFDYFKGVSQIGSTTKYDYDRSGGALSVNLGYKF